MSQLDERCRKAAEVLANVLVKNAPKDTWNLARNGIRIIQDNGFWYVVIGGEIAPYAVYTNEPWNDGTNPNEGWIERSIEEAEPMIRQVMCGTVDQNDIDQYINNCETDVRAQHMEFVKRLMQERDQI